MKRNRVVVNGKDLLVVGKYELDATILEQILNPQARVLWAFVERDGRVMPVPYTEDRVVWLTDEDLVRADKDV
jgi:hypothetical protein